MRNDCAVVPLRCAKTFAASRTRTVSTPELPSLPLENLSPALDGRNTPVEARYAVLLPELFENREPKAEIPAPAALVTEPSKATLNLLTEFTWAANRFPEAFVVGLIVRSVNADEVPPTPIVGVPVNAGLARFALSARAVSA